MENIKPMPKDEPSQDDPSSITQLDSWKDLVDHHKEMSCTTIPSLFKNDPKRFDNFHQKLEGLTLDYSKQRVSKDTIEKLCTLAKASDLESWRDQMFNGDRINTTENRAVLHTALRNKDLETLEVDSVDIVPEIRGTFEKMKSFTDSVRAEKKYTHIVNIGIGGSDLGPHMVAEALKPFSDAEITVHYVSNVDSSHLVETLENIDLNKNT